MATITAFGSGTVETNARHRHAVDRDDAWSRCAHSIRPQQDRSAWREAAAADNPDPGVADLPFACLTAQLHDGFVDQAHPVGAAVRELAAVGVQRQHTVAGDAGSAVEEVLGLADAAEAERLDPRQAVEA